MLHRIEAHRPKLQRRRSGILLAIVPRRLVRTRLRQLVRGVRRQRRGLVLLLTQHGSLLRIRLLILRLRVLVVGGLILLPLLLRRSHRRSLVMLQRRGKILLLLPSLLLRLMCLLLPRLHVRKRRRYPVLLDIFRSPVRRRVPIGLSIAAGLAPSPTLPRRLLRRARCRRRAMRPTTLRRAPSWRAPCCAEHRALLSRRIIPTRLRPLCTHPAAAEAVAEARRRRCCARRRRGAPRL